MSMIHHLKCHPEPFRKIRRGEKKAEYRKNDRDFHLGDYLILSEYDPASGFTGWECEVKVTDITYGPDFGIPEGYCMMTIF